MGGKAIDPKFAESIMRKAGAKPLTPFVKKREPWRSKCLKCKRVITPTYGNVLSGHAACKYCAKGGVSEAEALEILRRANAKPQTAYPGFKKNWKCKCLVCKREINPRLTVVMKTGKACNFCNRRKVDPQEASKIADKAGAIPLEHYPGPGKWKCRCKKCKKIIYPTLRRMRNGQNPCGWCARVRIDPKEAEAIFLKAGLKPVEKYPGSSAAWRATCMSCGRTVSRSLHRISEGRYTCPFCSGRQISDSDAKKIMLKAGAKPLVPFQGIYKKWHSQCLSCFREIEPEFANVRGGHAPCIYCSGRKVDHETAVNFAISRGLKPLVKFPGATKRWKVKCLKCKRNSYTSWTTLQLKRKNAGCSSCTVFGFKPHEPAYFYVITHPRKKAHKVGIGNTSSRRIEKHISNGWKLHKVYEFRKGTMANRLEQRTLEFLRIELQIGPAYRKGDGWTETVPSESISLPAIVKKVETLSKGKMTVVKASKFYKSV